MHADDIAGLIGVGFSLVFTVGAIVVSVLVTVVVSILSIALPLGIVFLVFRLMAQNAAAERQLIATGAAAPARVVTVAQTGMYINNQPQVQIVLEVAPPEGVPFTASVTKVVSLIQIPRIQPGVVLEVRYDRANPSRIAIVGL